MAHPGIQPNTFCFHLWLEIKVLEGKRIYKNFFADSEAMLRAMIRPKDTLVQHEYMRLFFSPI